MHFQRPTLVARIDLLTPALRNLVRNSMWRLVSSKKQYLVSGQFIRDGQVVWRWDTDFLTPVNREAQEARCSVPAALCDLAKSIAWVRQGAVLIDNWCCVHARGDAQSSAKDELNRALMRYEFWGDARMVL
jgi:hypothetical protein